MESKKVESNAELTPFEKEFKVQLNLPAAYFSVFYAIYVVYMIISGNFSDLPAVIVLGVVAIGYLFGYRPYKYVVKRRTLEIHRRIGKTKEINQSCFQKIKDKSFVGDLTVLTSGVKVPNPSELLSNPVFEEFIKTLKQSYDFIIVDCPPVMLVSDAIPVGNVVDGTIFVCSSKSTNRKDAKAAVEVLQKNNVNILGTVLTQIENDGTNSGYYYYYYY